MLFLKSANGVAHPVSSGAGGAHSPVKQPSEENRCRGEGGQTSCTGNTTLGKLISGLAESKKSKWRATTPAQQLASTR